MGCFYKPGFTKKENLGMFDIRKEARPKALQRTGFVHVICMLIAVSLLWQGPHQIIRNPATVWLETYIYHCYREYLNISQSA